MQQVERATGRSVERYDKRTICAYFASLSPLVDVALVDADSVVELISPTSQSGREKA